MEQAGETGDARLATDVGTGSLPAPSINWVPVQTVLPGIHRATVTNISLTLGFASGKPVFVWEFRLDGGQLMQLRTSKKGEGARKGYECAKALGLARSFTRSEAVGRQCRVEVAIVGPWTDIVRVLPA